MIGLVLAIVVGAVAIGVYFFVRIVTGTGPSLSGNTEASRAQTTDSPRVNLSSIDLDQLTQYVVKNLPGSVSQALSSDDVKKIVQWNLDFIRSKRASSNGHGSKEATMIIVAGAETVDYVLEQAQAVGIFYTSEQVHAVLDAQMEYLESIGAAGPEIPPEPS